MAYSFLLTVTPCTGVWIEILLLITSNTPIIVTPCTGVWIEIASSVEAGKYLLSLPARECGLKFLIVVTVDFASAVTPCTGVWIEIYLRLFFYGLL